MPLPDSYLVYPRRRHGMDHDLYASSALPERPRIVWPGGARVALWINLTLEWFPLDAVAKPFLAPGGLDRTYPDFWNYTHRDYGNHVGVFRLMRMLADLGLNASVAINSALADRYPALIDEMTAGGHEIVAHGVDMNHLHHGGLTVEAERALIETSTSTLRRASGQKVRGWLSPGKSESAQTLSLLRDFAIDYVCDWPNDDMPYPLAGPAVGLTAMPHATELSDFQCLWTWHQTTEEFAQQIVDQFRFLYDEARRDGGRVMSLTLHPWISGHPHRVKPIRAALEAILAHAGVWPATGEAILDAFLQASPAGPAAPA